jgi:prolyl 4-hydroxylase
MDNFDWMAANTLETFDRKVTVRLRLMNPKILVLDNVLSKEECEELMAMSVPRLAPSQTIDRKTGLSQLHPDRTSESTYLPVMNPLLESIDRRCAQIMHLPAVNGEQLQVVRYQPGGQYLGHHDFFDPNDPGSAVNLKYGGQRASTLLMYLNDVPMGGSTSFPQVPLTIVPKQGSAVYFHYTLPGQLSDQRSLHSGDPVMQGEKWIATKWMRLGSRLIE